MADAATFTAIEGLMKSYFKGLHEADSKILATVFHQDARYINAQPADYMHHSLEAYLAIIDERTAPKDLGEPLSGEILSIEQETPGMAFVKARMTMLGRDYLDYLTLINDGSGWRIIAKVFTYQPHKKEA
jgi:hypothetical protein